MKKVITEIYWLFILSAFFFPSLVFSQPNSDCSTAILVDKEKYCVSEPLGYGEKLEINGFSLGSDRYFEKEHLTVWYKIKITESGKFSFELTPHQATDDWDFMLYKFPEDDNICSKNFNSISPIRANIARNDIEQGTKTGLKEGIMNLYSPAGINAVFSRVLDVKKGDVLYLITDNVNPLGKGHCIVFNLPKSQTEIDSMNAKIENQDSLGLIEVKEDESPKSKYTIILKDKFSKDSLKGKISVEMANFSITETDVINSVIEVSETGKMQVVGYAPGYLFEYVDYFVPKQIESKTITVQLKPLKEGEKVNLNNIEFVGNKAEFLPSSYSSLKTLLSFMKDNPNIQVEIGGHVNGPGDPNKRWFRVLSRRRAKAVKSYLIEKGISKKQLKHYGYGNKEMIYPYPKNDTQSSANRRVEVKVLKITE